MQSTYNGLELPKDGQPIDYKDGQFSVPDHPIVPFIEGDGTGRDIWKASQRVFDAAVEKAYGGNRAIRWFEIFAGEKAFRKFATWLPDDSVAAARDLRVSIKGPLTTPVGGGIRSLNVALRQILDLYACVRPVKYYQGVPSPVKHPEKLDIVIYRENTEDVYAGIEFKEGSVDAARLISFLNDDLLSKTKKKVRSDSGVGIKPISIFGTKRLVRNAIRHALETGRKTVTLVHKGNIQKFTEGAFREWGYEVATEEFRDQIVTERESWILGNVEARPGLTVEENAALIEPGLEFGSPAFREAVCAEVKGVLDSIGKSHGNGAWKSKILINDRIADSIFQQVSATVTNTGTAAITFSSIVVSSGSAPNFSLVTTGSSCPYGGGSLAASASCTVDVQFAAPAASTATLTGSILLTDNIGVFNGVVGIAPSALVQTLSLSGNAILRRRAWPPSCPHRWILAISL